MTLNELWHEFDQAMSTGNDERFDWLYDESSMATAEHWNLAVRWRNYKASQGPKPQEPGDEPDERQGSLIA